MDFINVAAAYGSALNLDIFEAVENAFKDHYYSNSDVKHASYLIKIAANSGFGSEEFIEMLDRIIGKHVYEINVDEILPIVASFYATGKARDKIFHAFF